MEIDFGRRGFTEEKVKDISNQYTHAKYTVTKFENYELGGIRVVIKFNKVKVLCILLKLSGR